MAVVKFVAAGTRVGKGVGGAVGMARAMSERLGREGEPPGNADGTPKRYAGRRGAEALLAKPLGSSKRPVPYGWSGRFARRVGRQRLPRLRRPPAWLIGSPPL
jgi:hypothetical protein